MAAPANTSLPTISGKPQLTRTLTANNGSWSNSPTSFEYNWQILFGSTWYDIVDLVEFDDPNYGKEQTLFLLSFWSIVYLNNNIRVEVKAINDDGFDTATSNAVGPVTNLSYDNVAPFLRNPDTETNDFSISKTNYDTQFTTFGSLYIAAEDSDELIPNLNDLNPLIVARPFPTATYQWQVSTDDTNWSNISGESGSFSLNNFAPLSFNNLYINNYFNNIDFANKYIRLRLTFTNSQGSTNIYSNSLAVDNEIKINNFNSFTNNNINYIYKDFTDDYLYLYEDGEIESLNKIEFEDIEFPNNIYIDNLQSTEYQWQVSEETIDEFIPDEFGGGFVDIVGENELSLEIDFESLYPNKIIRLKETFYFQGNVDGSELENFYTEIYSNYVYTGESGEGINIGEYDFPILSGYPVFGNDYVDENYDIKYPWSEINWGNPGAQIKFSIQVSEDNENWVDKEIYPASAGDWESILADDYEFFNNDDNFSLPIFVQTVLSKIDPNSFLEFEEKYIRYKIIGWNFINIETFYTDSFLVELTPPELNENFNAIIERPADENPDSLIRASLVEKDTSTNTVGIGVSIPDSEIVWQWQVSADKLTWRNIDATTEDYPGGASQTGSELWRFPSIETYYYGQWIRAVGTIDNQYFSDQITSKIMPIGLTQISLIEKDSTWRFILYDYEGNALGELVDVNNANLNFGINKNPTLSFDTTLKSPLGEILGNGLNEDEPLLYITAWRIDPYETNLFDKYKLQFSGIVFSTEEKGTDNNPTIGVTAVGAHYQLTKRIVNDAENNGRTESGIKPTTEEIHVYVADSGNDRINVFNTQTGAHVRKWPSTAGSGNTNGRFNNPQGIDISQNQYVYVADTDNHRIQKFDLEGNFILKWNLASSLTDSLNYPIDVAVDQLNGNVWVADRGNKRVVKFDANGKFILEVLPVTGCPMDTLRGISTDLEGNAYLADATDSSSNRGVYKITPDGTLVFLSTGWITSVQKKFVIDDIKQAYWVNGQGRLRRGPGKPQLTSKASTMEPSSIGQSVEIGPDKAIYFLESGGGTSKITKYNAANNKSGTIASNGSNNDQILNAKGMALARVGAKDAIEIISDVIEYSNQENNGGLIDQPDSWSPAPFVFIPPGSLGGYKLISSLIEDLNESFEWTVEPRFEFVSGDLKIGKMKMEPVLGSNLYVSDSIVFEYGFGKTNVDEYTIKKSIENMANKINYPAAEQKPYNVGNSNPDLIDKIGVYEDVISGSVLARDLRKNIVDLHFQYRSFPRLLAEITPSRSDQSGPNDTRTPIPLIEYNVGDIVGIGIKEEDNYRIPPAEARIYDIQIQIDSEGKENATLNLYFDS